MTNEWTDAPWPARRTRARWRHAWETYGAGDVLVLAHGMAAATRLVPKSAGLRRFRVITWDQRGFGRSSNTTEKGQARQRHQICRRCRHLGVVRTSSGGWTVLTFALAHPIASTRWSSRQSEAFEPARGGISRVRRTNLGCAAARSLAPDRHPPSARNQRGDPARSLPGRSSRSAAPQSIPCNC